MATAKTGSNSTFSWSGLRVATGFGLYFAWVSIVHYIYVFGGPSLGLGTAIAAAVSLVSMLFYGWVFVLYRRGNSLPYTRNQNYIVCLVAILGTLSLGVTVLQYFIPLLIGIPVAWFRMAYAEHFSEAGGRGTLTLVGLAFAICAVILIATVFLPETAVMAISVLAPIGCTLLLNSVGDAKTRRAESHRYNTSVHNYWKIAAMAFIISVLFDVTETHLVSGVESSFALGLPLGFLSIAVVALSIGLLTHKRGEFRETTLFIAMICCALLGAISFFLRPLITDVQLLMVVQTLGGYGFVTMLLVASASIVKQRNMQAGLVFAIVLCCQRLGNSVGEVIGSGIIAIWGSSPAAYATISILTVISYVSVFLIFLLQGKNPLLARLERVENNEELLDIDDPVTQTLNIIALQHGLTQREIEVFLLAADNRCMKDIEEELHISKNTLKTHLQRIYQKFGVHGRQELIMFLKQQAEK